MNVLQRLGHPLLKLWYQLFLGFTRDRTPDLPRDACSLHFFGVTIRPQTLQSFDPFGAQGADERANVRDQGGGHDQDIKEELLAGTQVRGVDLLQIGLVHAANLLGVGSHQGPGVDSPVVYQGRQDPMIRGWQTRRLDVRALGQVERVVGILHAAGTAGDVVTGRDELGHIDDQRGVEAVRSMMIFFVELDCIGGLACDAFKIDWRVGQRLSNGVYEDKTLRVNEVAGGVLDETDLRIPGILGGIRVVYVPRGEVECSHALVQIDPEGVVFGQTPGNNQRNKPHECISFHIRWLGPFDVDIVIRRTVGIEYVGVISPTIGHGRVARLFLVKACRFGGRGPAPPCPRVLWGEVYLLLQRAMDLVCELRGTFDDDKIVETVIEFLLCVLDNVVPVRLSGVYVVRRNPVLLIRGPCPLRSRDLVNTKFKNHDE